MIKKTFTVVALLCATTVSSLQAQAPDWYNNGGTYFKAIDKNAENNFTMTIMASIDEIRCDDAFEIAVFCGDECRLSKPFYSDSPIFEHYGYYSMLTVKGEKGETFHFRLYDHRNEIEVGFTTPPQKLDFIADATYGSFNNGLYNLAFNGSTTHRSTLTIDDDTDIPFIGSQYSITADGIECSYVRSISLDGSYETIVLPFDVNITTIKTAGFVFEKYEGLDDNTIKFVELTEKENLQAGIPYIFRYSGTPSEERMEIEFSATTKQINDNISEREGWTGTFQRMNNSEIAGKYILNISGDKIQKIDNETSLAPYHCYLELPVSINAEILTVSHRASDNTGIRSLRMQDDSEYIFDMHGRKLDEIPKRGIIIKNNKKIHIK